MKRSISFFLVAGLLVAASVAPTACESGTGGRIIELDLASESMPAAGATGPSTFVTRTGWTVTLEEARVVVSALYAYAPPDAPAMASLGERARRLVLPVAHAHGGVDPLNGRRVRTELLDAAVIDALAAGTVALEHTDGEAGAVDEAAIELGPPDAALSAETHGHHAWIIGTAVQGTTTVSFEGGLDLPDEGLVRRVEGIELAGALDDRTTLVLEVHASEWLADAHFDQLTTTAASGRMEITPESQVRGAWYLGIRSGPAWTARIDDPTGEMR